MGASRTVVAARAPSPPTPGNHRDLRTPKENQSLRTSKRWQNRLKADNKHKHLHPNRAGKYKTLDWCAFTSGARSNCPGGKGSDTASQKRAHCRSPRDSIVVARQEIPEPRSLSLVTGFRGPEPRSSSCQRSWSLVKRSPSPSHAHCSSRNYSSLLWGPTPPRAGPTSGSAASSGSL